MDPLIVRGGGQSFPRGGSNCLYPIRTLITCVFSWGAYVLTSNSSHENSLFRCFVHGLKLCMSCALDILANYFLSHLSRTCDPISG